MAQGDSISGSFVIEAGDETMYIIGPTNPGEVWLITYITAWGDYGMPDVRLGDINLYYKVGADQPGIGKLSANPDIRIFVDYNHPLKIATADDRIACGIVWSGVQFK